MPKKQTAKDLVADLTWAELYTTEIRHELRLLTTAVKTIPTEPDPELTESAMLLRRQLESAKRTSAQLRTMVHVNRTQTGQRQSGREQRGS